MYLRSRPKLEFSHRGRSKVFTRDRRLLDDRTPFADELRTLVADRMLGVRAETAIEINDFGRRRRATPRATAHDVVLRRVHSKRTAVS
jgi:hypothetical protein